MQISKILVAFFLAALFVVAAHGKQLRGKKEEPTSHMPQALDEDWRKYVVPAGEPNQGKIFYFNTKTKEKTWDAPTAKKGNSPVKYITVDGGFAK